MTFGISNDNATQEVMAKYPVIEKFCEHLHGSGVNFDWTAEETKTAVILHNGYDNMNEAGMYTMANNFSIRMPKDDITGFRLTCNDKSRYWWDRNAIGDYLRDTIALTLDEILTADPAENIPVKSGFIAETKYRLVQHKDI